MFTHEVREVLAAQYGIRDIPDELLRYFIIKHRANFKWTAITAPAATVALLIANEWQRGRSVPACSA